MIGSIKDLYNASKGSFKPRVIEEPWDPTKFSNTLTGYSAAGTSAQSPFSGNVKPTSQFLLLQDHLLVYHPKVNTVDFTVLPIFSQLLKAVL
jgi:hypothetical protein